MSDEYCAYCPELDGSHCAEIMRLRDRLDVIEDYLSQSTPYQRHVCGEQS